MISGLYLHPQPLFYGANEKEVLYRICTILGSPNQDNWAEGVQLAHLKEVKFPNCFRTELKDVIKNASEDAIDLMERMLRWDPKKRETADNLLKHKFFENIVYKDFNYNINLESNGSINKNIISKDENISFKLNKNELLNDSSKNLITEKTDNDKFEIKKETENNFSSLLNDTNGFNKMLSELKEEKKQEDKDFEKQKEKNEYSNLWLSIERKLDINTNDNNNNKSVNKFLNEIEEKEKKEKNQKEKIDIEYNQETQNLFLDELNFEKNINNINNIKNNKDNNIKQTPNDIFTTPIDLGLNLNNYNKNNNNENDLDLDNLINKDNNDEFNNFENAKRLKPLVKNNRRGSARKFLEENENKMKQNKNINMNNQKNINNDQIQLGRRRIKYNFSNEVLPKIDKKNNSNAPFIKREYSNINGIFDNKKKEDINGFNLFNKRIKNLYEDNITLTNDNKKFPSFLRDNNNNNKKDKFFDVKHIEAKNKPNFFLNKNFWDL